MFRAESRPMESVLSGPGMATASLLLLYQLEDKHKVHNLLLGFLKSIGLWGRMSTVTNNSRVLSTRLGRLRGSDCVNYFSLIYHLI